MLSECVGEYGHKEAQLKFIETATAKNRIQARIHV